MQPHPPLTLPTPLEAKHWGATHALYRFSNSIQLHLVLPTGPREYWQQLAEEHKSVPDHLKWQYESDPFAAQDAVKERQKALQEKRDKAMAEQSQIEADAEAALIIGGSINSSRPSSGAGSASGSKGKRKDADDDRPLGKVAPEVKMATQLRDLVEAAIKNVSSFACSSPRNSRE
jgi:ATP-dependent RNA helicase DHX57